MKFLKLIFFGFAILTLCFITASVTKADTWGSGACLALPGVEWSPAAQQAMRDCDNIPPSGNIPNMQCGLHCFQSNGNWWYRCEPGTDNHGTQLSCPANYTYSDREDGGHSPQVPQGADPNSEIHSTCAGGCGNTFYCWLPLNAVSPTQTPTPTQGPQFHCSPNSCVSGCGPGDICFAESNCLGTCVAPPTPTPAQACNHPCGVSDPTYSCTAGQPQGNLCTECLADSSGTNFTCQQPPVPTNAPGCGSPCNVSGPACTQGCTCVSNGGPLGVCTPPTNTPVPPQSTPPPTSTVAPSATPTVGVCVSGQTQCSNCNGDPAHCTPDCSGGWCNGGICQTCQPGPGGNGNCSIGKDCGPPRAGVSVTPGPPQSYWLDFPDKQGLCVQSAPRSPTWPVERCVPYTSPTVPPPTATATPIPATPTPIQPTSVISMIPTPTNNPNRPHPTSVPAKPQRWVCLRQEPCSNPSSGCSVLDDHRVKLSVKTDKGDDAKPLAGKPTYIFECLQLGNQRICTTGVETTDIQAVGVTHLQDKIVTDTGYQYNGIFMDTGAHAINPIPADQQNNGDFGVREWKSYSDVTIPRIFLAMNDVDANTLGGDQGALQQGILALVQGGSKSCVQIQWDPYGEVLNKWNLQPVSGAQVILYKKSADGAYSLVTGNDVMGMFQNPISTDQYGTYNFIVPDGTYKVNIKAPGYELYQGSDIVQKDGKAAKHDVKLVPQSSSLIDKVVNYLHSSFISQ